MTKPEDVVPEGIPQWAWDASVEALNGAGWFMRSARIACAKAILSAVEEEREEIAQLVASAHWSPTLEVALVLADTIRNRKEG